MPIRWTKTHRKKLAGVRHPHRSDPPVAFPDPASGWAWLRERHAECVAAGSDLSATPEYQSGLDRVVAELASERPPSGLTPELELYRATLSMLEGVGCYALQTEAMQALLAVWSGEGPAFVVSMAEAVASFGYLGTYGGGSSLRLEPVEPNPYGHKHHVRILGPSSFEGHYLQALRGWLFRLDEADFQEALAAAAPIREALRASGERELRESATLLSWAFSRDPAWAVEDVEAALAGELHDMHAPQLLASLTDPVLALRFAKEGSFGFIFPFLASAHDLMESLGDDALAVLEVLRARARYLDSRQKRQFESVLKLARTAHPGK